MSYQIPRLGWLRDAPDHRDCDARSESVRARLNQIIPLLSADVKVVEDADANANALLKVVSSTSKSRVVVGALRVDLRKWCSAIENQGEIGSCTAHAVVGALEYFERKARGESVDASRRFLYRVTRRYLGWEGKGDTGAFLRSTIKALRIFGALPEEYWPYDEKKYDEEPQAFHYAYAQSFKALEYFRVPENVDDLKQVLKAGLPFVFGFTCFNSIFNDDVSRTGIIPYPTRADRSAGGHAVMAVGYTDSHILIRNSWDKTWGEHGYGYLPWTYFDSSKPLADDCWVLLNAAWMPEDEGEVFPRELITKKAKAVTKPERRTVDRPSIQKTTSEERVHPLVRVTRGSDPIRQLPLRLTGTAGSAALKAAPDAQVQLLTTSQSVSLYLKSLKLLDSFEFSLFGKAVNELYVSAICWDLSGRPPRVFPSEEVSKGELKAYNVKKDETVTFIGDGLQLWPSEPIVGGLYLRLIVMESDSDVRALGDRIAAVHEAVKSSTLTKALEALLVAGGLVSAPVLAAVGAGAEVLTTVVSKALQEDDDDLVALFDGTYAAESVGESKSESYAQAGAEIRLEFRVREQPKSKKAATASKARADRGKSRRK